MNKLIKFVYVLGAICFGSLLPVLAQNTGETATTELPRLFKMYCDISNGTLTDVTQTPLIPQYLLTSGSIQIKSDSGFVELTGDSWQVNYLQRLANKGYTKIYKFGKIILGDQGFTYIMAEKCGYNVVKILSETYKDDINVFDIQTNGDTMKLVYKDPSGTINTVNCSMKKSVPTNNLQLTTNNKQETGNLLVLPVEGESKIQKLGSTGGSTSTRDPRSATPISVDLSTYRTLKNTPLYKLVQQRGYDRKTDRKSLAEQAGIENYQGTKTQNLKIKEFLLKNIALTEILPTQTQAITLSSERFEKVQKIELWRIVGLRGYVWRRDRINIAVEFGYNPKVYYGTKVQNLKIRNWLLEKISVKE